MLLELIGPDRIVDPRKSPDVADYWNYGDPFETYPIDTGRLKRVAQLAADQAGWGKTLPKGEGFGIAAHRSFLTYVATVVRAAVDDKGKLSIRQVDTAIDCGFHVNPERIHSQIEGAAVMGLALAKHGQITFKDGIPQQSNFDGFMVARIDDAPLDGTLQSAGTICVRTSSGASSMRATTKPSKFDCCGTPSLKVIWPCLASASPITAAPSICEWMRSGLMWKPQSIAVSTCRMLSLPLSSTAARTTVAT
jgi:hypothetical protein